MFSFIDAQERITNKALKGDVLVLIIAGKLKTISSDSKTYADTLAKADRRMLGVYNKDCDPKWLSDDLLWADTHMAYTPVGTIA